MANWWLYRTEEEEQEAKADDFSRLAEQIRNRADADLMSRQGAGILGNLYSAAEKGLSFMDDQRQQAQESAQQAASSFGDWATDRLKDVNQSAVESLNSGGRQLGESASQFGDWAQDRLKETPNPFDVPEEEKGTSRKIADVAINYAADQGGKLLEANKLGWQRFGNSVSGGIIPMTDEEKRRGEEVSKDVIENNPFSPLPFAQTPELRGLAPFQEEALRRIGQEKKAAKPVIEAAGAGIEQAAPVIREAADGVMSRVGKTLDMIRPGLRDAASGAPSPAPHPDASWIAPETRGEMLPVPQLRETPGAQDDSLLTRGMRTLGMEAPTAGVAAPAPPRSKRVAAALQDIGIDEPSPALAGETMDAAASTKPKLGYNGDVSLRDFGIDRDMPVNYKADKDGNLVLKRWPASDMRQINSEVELQPLSKMAEIMGSNRPEYLQGVIDYMVEKRQKIKDGDISARDVAKAYVMTVSSQGQGAVTPATITEKTGFRVPAEFLDQKGMVRPEEAAAAWLLSPQGKKALNNIDRGIYNYADWAPVAAIRNATGDNRFRTVNAFGSIKRDASGAPTQFNMTNMDELKAALNAAKGDPEKLYETVGMINGVSSGKTGFVSHFLGFGEMPTIDAVEINAWLTGNGNLASVRDANASMLASQMKLSTSTLAGKILSQRITDQFNALRGMGVGADLSPEVAQHVMHHWLWDKMKGIETTHSGLYNAMRNAFIGGTSSPQEGLGNAAGRAIGSGVGAAYQESQQEDATPESILQAGLGGAALGTAMGVANRGLQKIAPGARTSTLRAAIDASGEPPRAVTADPPYKPHLDALLKLYDEVTPSRLKQAEERAMDILAKPLKFGKNPDRAELLRQAIERGEEMLQTAKVVTTQFGEEQLRDMVTNGRVRSKFGSLSDLEDVMVATWRSVTGKKGEPKPGKKARFGAEAAREFSGIEGRADEAILGGTEYGQMDPDAIPRIYAHVTEGEPLVASSFKGVFGVWSDETPRVTVLNHHFGLLAPNYKYHASMMDTLKAAQWRTPFDGTITTDTGKEILNTPFAVGRTGESRMRMINQALGMGSDVKKALLAGQFDGDPDGLAAALLRGKGPQQQPLGAAEPLGAATSVNRTETLILDPRIENLRAIYIVGTPEKLAAVAKHPKKGKGRLPEEGGPSINNYEGALHLQEAVRQHTGREIPIYVKELTTGETKLIPSEISPGRERIRDLYVGAGFPDIGVVPRTADASGSLLPSTLRNATSQAAGQGIAQGIQASQEEGATPESVLSAAGQGALLGGANALGKRALPGLRNAELRGAMRALQTYGPADSTIAGSITPPPQQSSTTLRDLPDTIIRQLFDNTVPLKRVADAVEKLRGSKLNFGESAYNLMRLSRGSAAAAEQAIDEHLGPVLKGLSDQQVFDLNKYLKAMDIIDKDAASPGHNFGGATVSDALQQIQEMQRAIDPAEWTALQDRAQQVWSFGHDLLARKLDAGLIDQAMYADLVNRFPHYSPIRIIDWLDDAMQGGQRTIGPSQRLNSRSTGIKQLTDYGTDRAAETPLDAYVRLAHETYRRSMINEAASAMVMHLRELGRSSPEWKSMITPANESAAIMMGYGKGQVRRAPGQVPFAAYLNGERFDFYLDKTMEQAINFTGPDLKKNWATNLLFSLPADALRAGATSWNALFLIPNAMGDFMTYFIRNGGLANAGETLPAYAKGWKSALTKDQAYSDLRMAGGGYAGFFGAESSAGNKTVNELRGAVTNDQQLRQMIMGVLQAVPRAGERVESATRLAEFHRMRGRGAGNQEAALAARDVTIDFSRGGEFTKWANAFVPFFNVGFQAPAQVGRALRNPQTAPKAWTGLVTTVIIPTIGLEAYNRQFKEYEDVPQYDKDRGLIIMDPRGSTGKINPETGRVTPRYVPLNLREWAPFAIAVRESMARTLYSDPDRDPREVAYAVLKAVSPIDPPTTPNLTPSVESLAKMTLDVMPPAFRVGAELAGNYDRFRDRQIVPDALKRLPNDQQYTSDTSETAKLIGKGLGQSPMMVQHAVTGLGAGVGKQLLGAGDMLMQATGGTEPPTRRVERLQRELAKSGLPEEKRAVLQHELEVEQAKQQNRESSVKAIPVVGGFASTVYREQGGEIERRTGRQIDERLKQLQSKDDPTGKELTRLGVTFSDVENEIGGQSLNRYQFQQYRSTALAYREQALSDLLESPLYQSADDATKTRLARNVLTRAAAWASQEVLPGANPSGREFLTVAGKDISMASQGYLSALQAQQTLADLKDIRYQGYNGAEAEEIAQDRSYLSAFRDQFGDSQGDSIFLARYGVRRYARAKAAKVNPLYTRQVEQIQQSTPALYTYLRQNPTTTDVPLSI